MVGLFPSCVTTTEKLSRKKFQKILEKNPANYQQIKTS
jgi:hypothetical protein